jgi:hypothetical protein
MAMCGLRSHFQHDYIRFVRRIAVFLGRSSDTAQAKDIRRFQVHQREIGVQPPTINGSVSVQVLAHPRQIGETLDRAQQVIGRHVLLKAKAVEESLPHHGAFPYHWPIPQITRAMNQPSVSAARPSSSTQSAENGSSAICATFNALGQHWARASRRVTCAVPRNP